MKKKKLHFSRNKIDALLDSVSPPSLRTPRACLPSCLLMGPPTPERQAAATLVPAPAVRQSL